MKIKYNKTADAVYIRIRKGVVKKTAHLSHLVNADLDKNGNVLGVEILKASLKLSNGKNIKSSFNIPISVTV
jgi:uncharacterized protein YuzE